MKDLLSTYTKETECFYKNERYSVRDNGAVMRHPHEGGRVRPKDNKWTFGTTNNNGYCLFVNESVHRIVAVAFIGEPPTAQHVVDHIDTNRQNNRPENLRWVTKLENILLNQITVKNIIYACGSIEAFLANPSILHGNDKDVNFKWMRQVSKKEAENCLNRMTEWAKSDRKQSGGTLSEWGFNRGQQKSEQNEPQKSYILSLTTNAAQEIVFLDDKPNEFPCTPHDVGESPLESYAKNLIKGAVFFRNHNGPYTVVKSGFSKDYQALYVITQAGYVWKKQDDSDYKPVLISQFPDGDNDKKSLPHSLNSITYENGLYIHGRTTTGFMPAEYIEDLFIQLTDYSAERIPLVAHQRIPFLHGAKGAVSHDVNGTL